MPSSRSKRPTPFLSPKEIQAVSALPANDRLWIGGRRTMPDEVGGEAVDACFWVDVEGNDVRAFEIVGSHERPDALFRLLVDSMCDPDEDHAPVRPLAVASDDPRLTDFLSPVEIEVRPATGLIIDQLFEGLLEMLQEGIIDAGYLEREGVREETVRRFFEAADRLDQQAPWTDVLDEELLRIEGLRPHPVFVSIDGVDADDPALAIFENEADAVALVQKADDADPKSLPPYLVFSYEAMGVVKLLDEAEEHEWPVGLSGVPVLIRTSDPEWPLAGEDDLRLAADIFEVLASFDPSPRKPVDMKVGKARVIWPHTRLNQEKYDQYRLRG